VIVAIDPPDPISGEAARRAAEVELRKGEYHHDDPSVVTRVLDWIGRRFSSIVSGTPSGSATLIFLVLLVAVVVFAVWRAGRPTRIARTKRGDADPLATTGEIDHRELAAEFERQGQYAQAQREWLRAAIAAIEARGILDPRPGRTGAGVAREAGARLPAAAADLAATVDAFEQVWFGHRVATIDDVHLAHRVADAVRSTRIDLGGQPAGYAVPR
jgi:hypothetical protein